MFMFTGEVVIEMIEDNERGFNVDGRRSNSV